MTKKRTKKRVKVKLRNKDWPKLADEVKEAAGYVCQICGSTNRKILQVHHLKSVSTHPELEMVRENCVCVCVYCHSKKFHPEIKNFMLGQQRKKNRKLNSIIKLMNRR